MTLDLRKLQKFDWGLFILISLLVGLGTILQYSLSLANQGVGLEHLYRQLIFVAIGLLVFFIFSFTDFRYLRSASWLFYFLTIFLLLMVFFFGKTMRGTKGWLNLGFFNFQPAELAKLGVIIILTRFWQGCPRPVKFKHLLISFFLSLIPAILIFLQPDWGSAMVLLVIWLGILFLVNHNWKHYLILGLVFLLVSGMAWGFLLKDEQRNRILTFINPQNDPLGEGYQIIQSTVAIGSGSLFGRGFGLGTQSQLRFLPASETDFVFAVLAEELGLAGCLLVLIIYWILLFRLIRIGKTVYGSFSQILVLGIAWYLFIQSIINIGMNIGLVPIVGVPWPLISYGGSSLVVTLLALGIIESIIIHQPFTKNKEMI